MKLLDALRKALLLNELSGNEKAAYRFSDASKESGLSFGVTQLDVSHNPTAVKCLRECGFTDGEIARLMKKQLAAELSQRLAAHAEIIDRYDAAQIKECLDHVLLIARARKFTFANDEAILQAADYNNQFYMSTNGKMARALSTLDRPVTAEDILHVKLGTLWGQKRPDDVYRRYNNIKNLMAPKAA